MSEGQYKMGYILYACVFVFWGEVPANSIYDRSHLSILPLINDVHVRTELVELYKKIILSHWPPFPRTAIVIYHRFKSINRCFDFHMLHLQNRYNQYWSPRRKKIKRKKKKPDKTKRNGPLRSMRPHIRGAYRFCLLKIWSSCEWFVHLHFSLTY